MRYNFLFLFSVWYIVKAIGMRIYKKEWYNGVSDMLPEFRKGQQVARGKKKSSKSHIMYVHI